MYGLNTDPKPRPRLYTKVGGRQASNTSFKTISSGRPVRVVKLKNVQKPLVSKKISINVHQIETLQKPLTNNIIEMKENEYQLDRTFTLDKSLESLGLSFPRRTSSDVKSARGIQISS